MKVKVKYLEHYVGKLLHYATDDSAGFDIRAAISDEQWGLSKQLTIPTGLKLEIPKGYELQIRPRSGLAAKHGITVLNSPGTIDSDYRGEIKVILINHSNDVYVINNGDRIAQGVFAPIIQAQFNAVNELSETERGEGGFGSTGVL